MRHLLYAAMLVLIALLLVGCGDGNGPTTEKSVTITVDSKERGGGSGEDAKPSLVWATHKDGTEETFKVADSTLSWSHNSADVYGRLHPGETYVCIARGYRSTLLSSYRNLMECRAP